MKSISKYKMDLQIIIPILLFFTISIITLISANSILPLNLHNLYLKQIFWYIIGFIIILIIMNIKNNFFIKNIWPIYILGNILLVALLLFGTEINNSKCWFTIPGIGNFQPSEFMKIILIITNASFINKFNNDYKNPTLKQEFIFLIKIIIITLIPSILTFLQPDTGVVLIYLITTITMLFIAGIRYRWFIILFIIIISLLLIILGIYFLDKNIFVNIFGTSFFLRIDRLLDWSNSSGYQLENGMASIGSGGLFGKGFNNTPLYFPEAQTDFIFSVFASNFGFIGSLLLIGLITFFDLRLIKIALKNKSRINKYIISGIIGMLIYSQFQNIGMTFSILPITGITLPFISYGGSSLISYMIAIGLVLNISNESIHYKN